MGAITRGLSARVGVGLAKQLIQVPGVDAGRHRLVARAFKRDRSSSPSSSSAWRSCPPLPWIWPHFHLLQDVPTHEGRPREHGDGGLDIGANLNLHSTPQHLFFSRPLSTKRWRVIRHQLLVLSVISRKRFR